MAVKWVAQQWERAAGAEAGGFGADSVEMASLLRLVGACGRRLKAAQAAAICEALVRALRTFPLPAPILIALSFGVFIAFMAFIAVFVPSSGAAYM